MSFDKQFQWSLKFMPRVKEILGTALIKLASEKQDKMEASDLVLLQAPSGGIGVRIRNYCYLEQYSAEFTIRHKKNAVLSTELEKLLDKGRADFYFYGFATEDEQDIAQAIVIDLSAWRVHVKEWQKNGWNADNSVIRNHDGTSFIPFKLDDFGAPPYIILHCYPESLIPDSAQEAAA